MKKVSFNRNLNFMPKIFGVKVTEVYAFMMIYMVCMKLGNEVHTNLLISTLIVISSRVLSLKFESEDFLYYSRQRTIDVKSDFKCL